jgi:hypothetical protein
VKRICGDFGHTAKNGKPCGFSVPEGSTCCHHHNPDPTRANEIRQRAVAASQESRLPAELVTNGFKTVEDCLRVKAQLVEILKKEKKPDYRRLELILKVTSSATADHAAKAMEEQNKLLLALDGHGPGLAVLQRLKESPVRVLPGKRITTTEGAAS